MNVRKIAIITSSYPVGVGESFLSDEMLQLSKTGMKVTIIPLYPRGKNDQIFKEHNKLNINYEIYPLISFPILNSAAATFWQNKGIVISSFWMIISNGSLKVRLKNILAFPKSLWLANFFVTSDQHHIHCHWGGVTSTAGMVAAKISKIPWSLTCHRWDIYENNLLLLKNKSASFTRFISLRGMTDSLKYGLDPGKCLNIPLGISLKRSYEIKNTSKILRDKFKIVCVANLLPIKGHKYLIQAVSTLISEGLRAELYLFGDGPMKKILQKQVAKLNISESVKFQGHQSRNYIMSMYSNQEFDVFALSSTEDGPGIHEGVPASIMEAMLYRIPVVATNTGSINEIIPSSLSATVKQRDPEALVCALRRVHDWSAKELNIQLNHQDEVLQNFSSETSVNSLIKHMFNIEIPLLDRA